MLSIKSPRSARPVNLYKPLSGMMSDNLGQREYRNLSLSKVRVRGRILLCAGWLQRTRIIGSRESLRLFVPSWRWPQRVCAIVLAFDCCDALIGLLMA